MERYPELRDTLQNFIFFFVFLVLNFLHYKQFNLSSKWTAYGESICWRKNRKSSKIPVNTTKGTRSSGNPGKYIVFGVSVCVCVCVCVCTPEYDRPTLGDNPLRLAIALTMVLMTYLQNHIHGHIISEMKKKHKGRGKEYNPSAQ